MCKTILFPVDFTVESLNLVKKICDDHPGETLDLLLVHGVHAPDSITDLLFFSKNEIIRKLTTPEFEEACQLLVKWYDKQINSLSVELFSGFTQSAFNRFIAGLKVDTIYCPPPFKSLPGNNMSADISRFLSKTTFAGEMIHLEKEVMLNPGLVPQISAVK